MVYICYKKTKCKECPHYRYDEDYQGYSCWAQHDLEQQNKKHNQEVK